MPLTQANWFQLNEVAKCDFAVWDCSLIEMTAILVALSTGTFLEYLQRRHTELQDHKFELATILGAYTDPVNNMPILELRLLNQEADVRIVLELCVLKCIKEKLDAIDDKALAADQASALKTCKEKFVETCDVLTNKANQRVPIPAKFWDIDFAKPYHRINSFRRSFHTTLIMTMLVLMLLRSPLMNSVVDAQTKQAMNEYIHFIFRMTLRYINPLLFVGMVFTRFGMLWRRPVQPPVAPLVAAGLDRRMAT